jgi:hypothetical protein
VALPDGTGHRLGPLYLQGQADERGSVLQGDGRLACFEAFVSALHGHAGQVRDAGHRELPGGRDGTATFSHGGTLVPGRNPRTDAAARAAGGKAYP